MTSELTPIDPQVPEVLAALTLEEKCRIVTGSGPFGVAGCARLDVPGMLLSDGPVGIRVIGAGPSMLFPCESLQGATWNPALVRRLGSALAREARDRAVDVVLGPTINLHRSPLGGRHFECYSEDPALTAELVVAAVEGIQGEGVAACVKHFVGNDQEHERTTIDVRIDDRTLREVYLLPFEAAVVRGGARAVMAAYNFVNGHHATAQPDLLVDVLKGEWGFDGVVMSDWGATKETLAPALHGLDLEMPGPGQWWGSGQLEAAVVRGDVPTDLLDDKVARILSLMQWCDRLAGPTRDGQAGQERADDRRLVRMAATDGMVLVNNDGVLPLAPGASIALIGSGAAATALMGGGSASLTPYRTTSIADSLTRRWSAPVTHRPGVDLQRSCPPIPAGWIDGDVRIGLFRGREITGAPAWMRTTSEPSAAWMGEELPEPRPTSAQADFTLVPDVSGPARVMVAAFGHGTLTIDGSLVVDNQVEPFSASLGLTGGTGHVMLEAGRSYAFKLEVTPREDAELPLVYFVVGLAVLPAVDDPDAIEEAVDAAAAADVAVVVVGTTDEWESEDRDRTSLRLPLDQDELVRRVLEVNPRTVVVLNTGGPVELPWLDEVPALLLGWYPGQEGGDAVVDVLVGDAEPGGRMPTTWPVRLADTPSCSWYPGSDGIEEYGEGRLIGHRWYAANDIEPLIAFGHGLSYTTFEWGEPVVSADGDDLLVTVAVTNTGTRPGSEVVQAYVTPPDGDVPLRLAGFAKVEVDAGATVDAVVRITDRARARFDAAAGRWVVDQGAHRITVAASAVDHRHLITHHVSEQRWTR